VLAEHRRRQAGRGYDAQRRLRRDSPRGKRESSGVVRKAAGEGLTLTLRGKVKATKKERPGKGEEREERRDRGGTGNSRG